MGFGGSSPSPNSCGENGGGGGGTKLPYAEEKRRKKRRGKWVKRGRKKKRKKTKISLTLGFDGVVTEGALKKFKILIVTK
ncbi:hypothetical protein LguiB_026508 [Lonicera macranthoides]